MLEVGPSALQGLKENSVTLGNTIMYKSTLHIKGMIDSSPSFQISRPLCPSLCRRVDLGIWELSTLIVITFDSFHLAIPSLDLNKVRMEFRTFENVHSLNVKGISSHFSQCEMPLCLPNSFSSRIPPSLTSLSRQEAFTLPMRPVFPRFPKQRSTCGLTVCCRRKSPLSPYRRILCCAR